MPGASLSCGAANCTDGVATAAVTCDGRGACPSPITTSCGAYACDATACRTSCAAPGDCAAGFECRAGACLAGETADAGQPDAGTDAGEVLAAHDAGPAAPMKTTGCGCAGVEGSVLAFAALGLLLRRRSSLR